MPLVINGQRKITDIDGNKYRIVTIGKQKWLVENLKASHYQDGTPISIIRDSLEWNSLNSGAFCWYNNDSLNKKKFGALYNWYAVNTGKLCPSGWHVPTNAEWDSLSTFISAGYVHSPDKSDVGKALATKTDWTKSDTPWHTGYKTRTNNKSGFSALPGGYRYYFGRFHDLYLYGTWWSSTESPYDRINAWSRGVYSLDGKINKSTNRKNTAFSIRCLKDR